MTTLRNLPQQRIENLPISEDVKVASNWPDSMMEMAAHIGPYATLLIAEHFGGLKLYIPLDVEKSVVKDLIGDAANAALCRVYGREYLDIPTAKAAIFHAKCGPVVAAVRAKKLSITQAAHILRTSRSRMFALVHHKADAGPVAPWQPKRKADTRQLVMFAPDKAA